MAVAVGQSESLWRKIRMMCGVIGFVKRLGGVEGYFSKTHCCELADMEPFHQAQHGDEFRERIA